MSTKGNGAAGVCPAHREVESDFAECHREMGISKLGDWRPPESWVQVL